MMFWGMLLLALAFAVFGVIVFAGGLWALYADTPPYMPKDDDT